MKNLDDMVPLLQTNGIEKYIRSSDVIITRNGTACVVWGSNNDNLFMAHLFRIAKGLNK